MARKPRETTCTLLTGVPLATPVSACEGNSIKKCTGRASGTQNKGCVQTLRSWCLTTLLLLTGVTLSGCELGNTMFQYSSGGSPWMGINLLPKKRSTSVIKHEGKPALAPSRKAEVQLVQQEEDVMESYRKKPLRLNLPAYRDGLQPTELTAPPETGFSVDRFAEKQF